ncbi:prolow-density lipoprotein receptor-related protein 1-like [Zophobas morio]|uniref:prolow-density lipoprotein receptor-related protein 1-like n=1 Tax=Zophobas morio TaxID=2755281 RepID=UPI0030834CAF
MNVYLFAVILLVCVFTINAVPRNKECTSGQTKKIDCNNCSCVNGKWVCTTKICSPRPQCISGQYKNEGCSSCRCINGKWSCISNSGRCPPSQRAKRGVPGASELKNTPCAPNDYFKIDCNTCYCNIDKTGYLCTENICSFTESPSSQPTSTAKAGNATSIDDVAVPQIQTVNLNATVLVIENVNSTGLASNSTNQSENEPLVITDINYTQTFYSNSSNFSDTDAGGTNKTISITHLFKAYEFTCTPGQTFKKDCNTCTCTQDGKNAICTLKRCNVVANVTQ